MRTVPKNAITRNTVKRFIFIDGNRYTIIIFVELLKELILLNLFRIMLQNCKYRSTLWTTFLKEVSLGDFDP